MEQVSAAAEPAQLGEGVGARRRLAQHRAIILLQHLVGTEHQRIAGRGDAARLHFGQHLGKVARLEPRGDQTGLGLFFVDFGRGGLERDSGRPQHLAARLAPGSQQESHSAARSSRSP
jgi:hypothetical protein